MSDTATIERSRVPESEGGAHRRSFPPPRARSCCAPADKATAPSPVSPVPLDVGELIKPFVFLESCGSYLFGSRPLFGIHPHSGIATVTVVLQGGLSYEDTTGKSGAGDRRRSRMDEGR